MDGGQGLERRLGVGQDDLDHPLNQNPLDGGVGPALDAQGGGAATAAQQHVDDRIDQVGIDRQQTVIVQLLGPEYRQDRRQGNGVQIVAEPDRRDVVERDLDVVGGEVPQGRRHQPHQAVEDDLEHRQTLVGDERGVDDGADAGPFGIIAVAEIEAQQIVDLVLVQDAFGGRARPFLAEGVGGGERVELVRIGHY